MARPPAADTRVRLLEEAERLFALRGFAGVSLREIGAAAGARNNSAAQYHFGDRQGLVNAVFDHRMAVINDHRLALLAALDAQGLPAGATGGAEEREQVRALVEAMVVPLATTVEPVPHSTYYARFSAQVLADPELVRSLASLDRPVMAGLREVYHRLDALLTEPAPAGPGLPHAIAAHRLGLAATLFVRALADREADRDVAHDAERDATAEHHLRRWPVAPLSFAAFVDGLVEAIAGLLLAPHHPPDPRPFPELVAETHPTGRQLQQVPL